MVIMQGVFLLLAITLHFFHVFIHHNSLIIEVNEKEPGLVLEEWILSENRTDKNQFGLNSLTDTLLSPTIITQRCSPLKMTGKCRWIQSGQIAIQKKVIFLNLKMCLALLQSSFDYTCNSWYREQQKSIR